VTTLAGHAADAKAIAGERCRLALDGLAATAAFHETADLLGAMADAEAERFGAICERIGPAAADALRDLLEAEELTPARARATAIVRRYRERAVSRIAPLTSSARWAAQRNAADLFGEIGAAEAVPLLQPLLRGGDPRVVHAAVRALTLIKTPLAARAIHTALRAATGDQRRAVVDALVAGRDPRVIPVLVRIVEESNPFGADHAIVLEALAALSTVGDDQAVPVLTATMRRRKLLGGRQLKALKQAAVDALQAIASPAAENALADAAKNGDRMLRRLVAKS
jgi:HEAT repeat protein